MVPERLLAEQVTAEALLADSVVVAEHKMYVQGGAWNTIFAQALPARHPRIGIGLVVRVPYALADNLAKRFELTLEDEDGNQPRSEILAGRPLSRGRSPWGGRRAFSPGMSSWWRSRSTSTASASSGPGPTSSRSASTSAR